MDVALKHNIPLVIVEIIVLGVPWIKFQLSIPCLYCPAGDETGTSRSDIFNTKKCFSLDKNEFMSVSSQSSTI